MSFLASTRNGIRRTTRRIPSSSTLFPPSTSLSSSSLFTTQSSSSFSPFSTFASSAIKASSAAIDIAIETIQGKSKNTNGIPSNTPKNSSSLTEKDIIPPKPVLLPRKRPSLMVRPAQPLVPIVATHPLHRSVIQTAPGRIPLSKLMGEEYSAKILKRMENDDSIPSTPSSSSSSTAPVPPPPPPSSSSSPSTESTVSSSTAVSKVTTDTHQSSSTYQTLAEKRSEARKHLLRSHKRTLTAYRAIYPEHVNNTTQFAVVTVGGKQYKVTKGDIINAERLADTPITTQLHVSPSLVGSTTRTIIGRPTVQGATVILTVESHEQDPKIIVFKKKRRKRYQRTAGHRREVTRLRVTDILCDMEKY